MWKLWYDSVYLIGLKIPKWLLKKSYKMKLKKTQKKVEIKKNICRIEREKKKKSDNCS
jgi:hypothetical protein